MIDWGKEFGEHRKTFDYKYDRLVMKLSDFFFCIKCRLTKTCRQKCNYYYNDFVNEDVNGCGKSKRFFIE